MICLSDILLGIPDRVEYDSSEICGIAAGIHIRLGLKFSLAVVIIHLVKLEFECSAGEVSAFKEFLCAERHVSLDLVNVGERSFADDCGCYRSFRPYRSFE